ncbi:hypothetical protein [Paenibacillus sp. MY03]|jgi:hypothetical protein|uniref:hypothetical protein n=1 Tax=Paenibacillus sp. MY03 TaxID=302980 RepID=UPI0015C59B56|nr:hypothetical protein [Paenibacillus sp. MY03]
MWLKCKKLFKLVNMSLCLMVAFVCIVAGGIPNSSFAETSYVLYSEELQLADIPGTE